MKLALLATVALGIVLSACTGAADAEEDPLVTTDALTGSFTSRATGYYPDSSALEGGFVDRRGARLRTLQQFLAGQADYVSVAMDSTAFPYGQHLRIQELEAKYGRAIDFRVVDTGGAFRGRGRSRIDICVANRSASVNPSVNRTLHINAVNSFSSSTPPAPTTPPNTTTPPAPTTPPDPTDPPPVPTTPPAGGGKACSSDGACNPGNDGSGLICTGGQCVPGCRNNAQCPGVTTCNAGQCS